MVLFAKAKFVCQDAVIFLTCSWNKSSVRWRPPKRHGGKHPQVGGSAMGKFRILSPFFMALGLLAFSGTWAGPATAAEDCPRSFLDERYCDRDGNFTADLPVDEGEWVDPDTIIFSYTPVEAPSVYKNIRADFIEHMTEIGRALGRERG